MTNEDKAREWLRDRWQCQHPNEAHVKMLAEYVSPIIAERDAANEELGKSIMAMPQGFRKGPLSADIRRYRGEVYDLINSAVLVRPNGSVLP